jgi:hypothetical protein
MTTTLPEPLGFRVKDLRRLTRKDLDTTHQLWRFDGNWQGNDAYWGASHLKDLGLGMYEWEGYHLVGFTNAKQHPHERWLYRTSKPVGEKQFTSRFFVPDPKAPRPHWIWLGQACGAEQEEDRYVESLSGELNGMLKQITRLTGWRVGLRPDLARHYYLLGHDAYMRLQTPAPLTTKPQYHLAHEMLHHYPEWLAKHPEAAGLPQDLVLRMYGLGAIADAVVAG